MPTYYVTPMPPYTFDQQVQMIAAKLRGLYLDMCGDLEFALADIIAVCMVKDFKEKESVKEVFLEQVTMGRKLSSGIYCSSKGKYWVL